jgi:hypothetical protein
MQVTRLRVFQSETRPSIVIIEIPRVLIRRVQLMRMKRLCLCVASMLAMVSCMPMPTACEVVTLDKIEQYKVLSRYGRSYFSTDCESPVPQEILIEGQGYSVYIYLQARIPAEAFIGVRPLRSDRFMLTGESLREDSPESAFRDRVTHFVRLNELPNRIVNFQVVDRETGKIHPHSFKAGSVTCTCKTYSGP